MAWVVMEPHEGFCFRYLEKISLSMLTFHCFSVTPKRNSQYIKNGHVLCSVDTLTMHLCCNFGSNSKFESGIKREMRLLESEIEGRKLVCFG